MGGAGSKGCRQHRHDVSNSFGAKPVRGETMAGAEANEGGKFAQYESIDHIPGMLGRLGLLIWGARCTKTFACHANS